jgi:hypothetical protein
MVIEDANYMRAQIVQECLEMRMMTRTMQIRLKQHKSTGRLIAYDIVFIYLIMVSIKRSAPLRFIASRRFACLSNANQLRRIQILAGTMVIYVYLHDHFTIRCC